MSLLDSLISFIPEIAKPEQKKLPFKTKLYWTLAILVAFYVLGNVQLFGLGADQLSQFELLSIIMGAEFGSIMTLGIGPIVTASIVLSLLKGSGLINIDTSTPQGKKRYHGINRLLGIGLVIFEAFVYVQLGALSPATSINGISTIGSLGLVKGLLIAQLTLGGLIVVLMDDLLNKWGFGSGISIFIVAGVAKSILLQLLSPFTSNGAWGLTTDLATWAATGRLWQTIAAIVAGQWQNFFLAFIPIVMTVIVFALCVFFQSMKIEVPLQMARYGGFSYRHPLNFLYTSNIPVIFIAALLANVQLLSTVLNNWVSSGSNFIANTTVGGWISYFVTSILGTTDGTSLASWAVPPNVVERIITTKSLAFGTDFYLQIFGYSILLTIGSIIFSVFWVQTSGADEKSLAKSLSKSGLQIPGTRSDPRILERHLSRYIGPLTIMGGLAVGLLAAFADVSGTLTSGTGILLAVMIVYKLYEDIAREHMGDFNPAFKKMMS